MKYYDFFLLSKREEKKKELIWDKVEIENFKMWVIKWESWNDNREEKKLGGGVGSRNIWYLLQLRAKLIQRAKLLWLQGQIHTHTHTSIGKNQRKFN